jgi:uncharacterized protein (TIGR03083 family)
LILEDVEARAPFVVSLVRAGANPSSPVAGLDWTVGQLGAHMASTADRYSRMAEGEAVVDNSVSERRIAVDSGIDEHLEATADEQANAVEAGTTRLVTALRGRSDDERNPYYGIEVPPSLIAGIYLTELLVHGVDLARTHHRPPEVPDRAAYRSLLASSTLTSLVLTPWGRTCSMVLGWAPRGHPPIVIALDHGEVRVTHHSDRRVDAWFGGSAADLLLASYGRLSTLASLRTLRLRGRRPYRSLLTARAFESA